jgi:AAA15 family ATPase/GTPase
MQFFQNLELHNPDKELKCIMADLGRINIVCGKNNSGKSTVLNAISNPKLRTKMTRQRQLLSVNGIVKVTKG